MSENAIRDAERALQRAIREGGREQSVSEAVEAIARATLEALDRECAELGLARERAKRRGR